MSISSTSKPRVLKVLDVGDYWRHKIIPQLRIQGNWLAKAGIFPNRHVQIDNPHPGVLIVRLMDEPVE